VSKFVFAFYLIDNFSGYSNYTLIGSVIWGYKFDLAISAIVSFITTLFDFHKKILISVFSILAVSIWLIQISDIMYFYESSRHIGYEIGDMLTDLFGLLMTAFSQHTLLITLSIVVAIFIYISVLKVSNYTIQRAVLDKTYIVKKLFLLLLTVFFVRGMTQNIPLNPWQSNQIGDPKLASIALNGTYKGLYFLLNQGKKLNPMSIDMDSDISLRDSIKSLYSSKRVTFRSSLQKPNIVIFFLESWSAYYMKSYGYNISTTPFFDSIIEKSIRPKAMIAGGHRTTEGVFSTLVSYQNPLGRTVAKTQLQDYKYRSLLDILHSDNYSSVFFQGSSKETSGTGSFVQSLGFQESYGKRDIEKRLYEENYWGVHDPDLYNFTFEKISNLKKPFVIGLNGATTHDNKLPDAIESKVFSKDIELDKQLNALHFSDQALKEFFEKVLRIYPNTLFVFLADHCGSVKGSILDNYMIPFAIYHKDLEANYYDVYLSQRDIAPTLLDILYKDYKSVTSDFTGKSLVSDSGFFADYYHDGYLGWIENGISLEINLATNKHRCIDITTFNKKEVNCSRDIVRMRNRALSFTKLSQELLFSGRTKEFKEYK
jgi:phosphoglycerol transferase MdoB-like AlkP superfamily enzyme